MNERQLLTPLKVGGARSPSGSASAHSFRFSAFLAFVREEADSELAGEAAVARRVGVPRESAAERSCGLSAAALCCSPDCAATVRLSSSTLTSD